MLINKTEVVKKWGKVLDHDKLPKIKESTRREVTAVLLENQQKAIENGQAGTFGLLNEVNANQAGAGVSYSGNSKMAGVDPILISLVRRAAPNMMAFDVCGVQPMSGPVGLIFAMKSRYSTQSGTEALFNEANTNFSSDATPAQAGTNPAVQAANTDYTTGRPLTTLEGESLGDGVAPDFAEMAFSIEKIAVTAGTRALAAGFTNELAQDLKAIHGLEAKSILADILSQEILFEQNREVTRTIYFAAVEGAQTGVTTPGTFDLDTDSNGRWSVERFKGLLFQIEKDANAIAKATRRGKGNIIITTSDVASALSMAGFLDTGSDKKEDLNVDDTGSTFAGVLNGKFKVFIDPYVPVSATNYVVVGYKGASEMDAGIFFAPYVPLEMYEALDPKSFQPRIGFKTRYGMIANPFASSAGDGVLGWKTNVYYRRFAITNLT